MDAIDEKPDLIQRGDRDDLTESREAEVRRLCQAVKDDLEYWQYAFKRMTKWRQFARGYQWPGTGKEDMADPDRQYVTNVTMRHIQQRTASIYAKNPRFRFKKAKRLLTQYWDGTGQQLQLAQEQIAAAEQMMTQSDPAAMMIVQDAMESRVRSQMQERVGEHRQAQWPTPTRQAGPARRHAQRCDQQGHAQQLQSAFTQTTDQGFCGVGTELIGERGPPPIDAGQHRHGPHQPSQTRPSHQ
jgi:hypothetical protein